MASNNPNITSDTPVTLFSLKDFVQLGIRNWKWILSSLIICLGLGFLYIKCQEPEYERSEEILIKDQQAGGGVGGMSATFASMGLVSGNTNVYNELISITSPAVLGEVIERLRIDVDYIKSGFFHGTTLYGVTLPFEVKFVDLDNEESAEFKCKINPDNTLNLYKFISYDKTGEKIKYDKEVTGVKIGTIVKTPVGNLQFSPNKHYNQLDESVVPGDEITISKSGMQNSIEKYERKITGDLKEEFADVIELIIKDVNVERAIDILTGIVNVYNENWVLDKNKVAKATSAFIEERLRIIEQELGEVDSNIAKYRSNTGAIHLSEKSSALLSKEGDLENQIVNLTNTMSLCKYMLEYLKDSNNNFKIIPVNAGVQSNEVEIQINTYNSMLLDRNSLVSNSSESNPLVKDYDLQLANLRNAILKGMSNRMVQLQTLLSSAKAEQAKALGSLKETPAKSLPLLSEQRQQSVKENLYLFLLEKREENELSQKFTADNTRIITPPMGSLKPVSPKKAIIMLGMFVFGLALPWFILYFKHTNDTKVRSKKDLERVKVPFAGEIPEVAKSGKRKLFDTVGKIKLRKEDSAPMAVVAEGERDVVNEAFRVIRSNIDFMIGGSADKGGEVILVTSFNPGSGKSFVSYNLGLSFALKKKRVLLVDCDLRHGSSSMYVDMPSHGITDYLRQVTDDWSSLVKKSPSTPSIDILPVGKMPPNPVELLENGRLEQLVAQARNAYDIVILDCPPVNIVVDTQIVAQCADRTLFIVRAGLLEKSALAELNEFYAEKKFNNMSVLLNGTTAAHSRYYTYGTYQSYNKKK